MQVLLLWGAVGKLGILTGLGPVVPGSNPGSPIFNKMASKLKKTKSAGRFGVRYGKKIRSKLVRVEEKQRIKQKCLFCNKEGAKRISKGIWDCTKCGKKFSSDAYCVN